MPIMTDPVGTLRHYIDSFNKGDVKAMAAACDDPMSILDGSRRTCGTDQQPVRIGTGT